ncbi:YhfC family glutamic-type intramembrane protease [Neobacillus pocheonensis]|uniref:YhfC family glutamic-type intramembrane protease n=1 Tax=Neobacillus pocheonensis TaxID=363869 RepID=A0ABT0WEP3_9BACI|nr:YhfC family glutamic-type intramembrane protease [Neobacillus pocheonensis]
MMKAILASPVYLLVSVLFWLFFWKFGHPMLWAAFGLGVLGWWIAYLLRAPISLVLIKIAHEKQPKGIVYFSGLLEESVRLIVLKMTGTSFQQAISVGQGWAFIEVLFAIVNLLALTNLNNKSDEKSLQAKEMLSDAGIKLDGSPFWGALERVFASGFHIGSTLLIARNPWMILAMIPVHTAYNVMATRLLLKRSIVTTELVGALFGSVVFIVGLFVYFV